MQKIESVPIYAFTKKRMGEKRDEKIAQYKVNGNSEIKNASFYVNQHPNDYEYSNYIVGFIDVFYGNNELIYELVHKVSQKYDKENKVTYEKYYKPYFGASGQQHYMRREHVLRMNISETTKNEEIANEIKEDVVSIFGSKHLPKDECLDIELLSHCEFVDYKKMFAKIDKQNLVN